MHSTLYVFPCDLGDPILIPACANSRTADQGIPEARASDASSVSPQSQEGDEWADVT